MRELSKLAKFFIICAAVFFVGMVCAIAGVVTGGTQDIDKLADRYDWIHGSPGERGVTAYPVEEFHSIAATGDADLYIVGRDFYKKASWLADQDILEQTELDVIDDNKVIVVAGDKLKQPEITVKKGVLNINSGPMDLDGINLDMTETSWYPKVLVCVPDEVLESLTVSGQTGDVTVLGTGWENAKIQMNSGDVVTEGVKSGGLVVELDSGDAELQGKFMNVTQAGSDAGDVEIDTSLAKAEYAIDLNTSAGEIEIKEPGKESQEFDSVPASYKSAGGPHRIIANCSAGDIEVHFENN